MFPLLFDALGAWNQAGFLLGGAFCGGLGALFLGSRIHWRLRAQHVSGTLIGVRETSPKMYAPVYRYALPDGQSVEVTSNTGSSSISGLSTGAAVPLLVFASHPDTVEEAGSYLSEIVGTVFVCVAGVFVYIALTAWPLKPLTWLMLGAIVVHGGTRLRKVMPAPGQRPLTFARAVATVRAAEMQAARRESVAQLPVRSLEEIRSEQETPEQTTGQRNIRRFVLPLVLLAGIGMVFIGVYQGMALERLNAAGERTRGKVISLEQRPGAHSSSYYPVVRFRVGDGTSVTFRDRVGSSPPLYHPGESVAVLYLPGAASASAIIDRGWWNWFVPVALLLFGPFLAWAALRGLSTERRP